MTSQSEPAALYQPRIDMVDALRGFALMGLFFNHATEFYGLYWAHPTPSVVHDALWALFEGKSFSLLALCFGLSFFIIMDRAAARGVDFSGRFVWRLTILFVLGWLHGLIYNGEVLQVLAPLGLLLIPLDRIKNNAVLLALAALCLLQLPLFFQLFSAIRGEAWANRPPHFLSYNFNDIYMHGSLGDVIRLNAFKGQFIKWWYYIESGRLTQIGGLYMVGLVLGRTGVFQNPQRFVTQRRIAMAAAVLVWIGLYVARTPVTALIPNAEAQHAARLFATIVDGWMCLAQMSFVILLLVELYLGAGRRVIGLLAPVGRMTLTLYVVQSLVFVPLYYGFGLGLHATLSQAQALGLGIGFFALQVALAHLWFRVFYYGPLEWLWRAATYLRLDVPFWRGKAITGGAST